MTLDESVHGMRLRVIERTQVLGNVSAVCREQGISRTQFYRWRKRLERYGVDGVHPRRQRSRAGRPVVGAPWTVAPLPHHHATRERSSTNNCAFGPGDDRAARGNTGRAPLP
jgi:transposase-like protein